MDTPRRARLKALAKLNLDLKVLNKRPDGFHELRTVFQTISLADELEIEFTPGRRSVVTIDSETDIPDNLVVRAARALIDKCGIRGQVKFRLDKRIPMGAGLGGGSSDAAAVLLALPVLAGKNVPMEQLTEIGAALGSDVPFFLLGGTAVGIGRGTELYPLPDTPARHVLLVAPEAHVSTPAAYRALGRELTEELPFHYISSFQSRVWKLEESSPSTGGMLACENDFEAVVFEQFPQLKAVHRKLRRAGARPARLTGSGAALFGVFESRAQLQEARSVFQGERAFEVSLVPRTRYRSMWWRQLSAHVDGTRGSKKVWPLPSRYAK